MKKKPLTSIIMLAYDLNKMMRNVTALSIEAITKYTNEEDYELILMDTIPEGVQPLPIPDTFNVFKFKRIIQDVNKMKNPGQYQSYNIGAKVAKGDYLCFMQNDVIVTEGWLDNLKFYLDNNICQSIQPSQFPKTRQYMKDTYGADPRSAEAQKGARDAGMIMMTKQAFKKIKGWNKKFKMFYGESDIYERLNKADLLNICTTKTQILHLNSMTYWARTELELDKQEQDISESRK